MGSLRTVGETLKNEYWLESTGQFVFRYESRQIERSLTYFCIIFIHEVLIVWEKDDVNPTLQVNSKNCTNCKVFFTEYQRLLNKICFVIFGREKKMITRGLGGLE